jgi:RNA polymerase sigma factor (TIGR02999 family)
MCEDDLGMRPNSSDNSDDPSDLVAPSTFTGTAKQLFPVVYQQLRDMAHRQMAREKDGLTLQTTALVHEVYVRLSHDPNVVWESPRQFFAVAAESMRRILVERARRYATLKRGGGRVRIDFDAVGAPVQTADPSALLALDEALTELSVFDARLGEVVMLRYFTGLSVEETADALESSPRTVRRDWSIARAWLGRKLSGLAMG